MDVFKGATDQSLFFELVDSTTGLPKTGIVYTSITAAYTRTRTAKADITPATLASAAAAHADGGFILVNDTTNPGLYRLDVPDAAFATGVPEVVITIVATGCRTVSRQINLVDVNNQVAYAPNVAAGGVGGLLTAPTTANTGLSNVTQLLGTAWLTPGTAGTPDVNAKLLGGTAQTGRDIGTSVLLSSGTGAGQLDFTSGVVKSNWVQILGTAITGTAAQLAAAITKFFNVATPTGTVNSLPDAVPGALNGLLIAPTTANTGLANVTQWLGTAVATPTVPGVPEVDLTHVNGVAATGSSTVDANIITIAANAITAASIATDAVTEIQSGLATQTSVDDLPTNAELATALGTADDAVLAAIALLAPLANLIQASGSVTAVTSATEFNTDLPSSVNNFYADSQVVFTTGANAGVPMPIYLYDGGSGKTLTLSEALPVTPTIGDDFIIVSLHVHALATIRSGLALESTVAAAATEIGKIPRKATAIAAGAAATKTITGGQSIVETIT